MGKKNEITTCTFLGAFEQAQNDHENLTADIRESADSMEETFPGAERTERYAEAADALESIDLDVEVPEEIANNLITYGQDSRKGQPRRTALSNLAGLIEGLIEALPEQDADEAEEMDIFRRALEEALGYLEGIEL